ncbi:MAG: hypothetical protein WC091_05410 [Sulfuricellaceae bacterium]
MPPLEDKHPPTQEEPDAPGQSLAIWAEALYLCNLLLAPGICFVLLLWLYFTRRASAPALAVCHLKQAIAGSLWAGVLLGVVSLVILAFGGIYSGGVWMTLITYFVCFHTTLVMLGVLGLAKAMAGQKYVYPLIGRSCD